MDEGLIDLRMQIRRFIEQGNIEEAIKHINNLNPEVNFYHQISYMYSNMLLYRFLTQTQSSSSSLSGSSW